jgi:hypothetical protein
MPAHKYCAVYNLRLLTFHGMEEVIGSIPIRSTKQPQTNPTLGFPRTPPLQAGVCGSRIHYTAGVEPPQCAWPHWQTTSTWPSKASQCGLQNFSCSGGTQVHAGLPHFFVSAIVSLHCLPLCSRERKTCWVRCTSADNGNCETIQHGVKARHAAARCAPRDSRTFHEHRRLAEWTTSIGTGSKCR